MAFASGQKSGEALEIKRYTGVGSFYVLAVNPSKEELEKFYERELDNAPQYVGEAEVGPEGNKVKVPQVRIDFIIKADPERYKESDGKPLNLITKQSFFLRKCFKYNKDGDKTQVIDKYGNTAWVTLEELKNHSIPVYNNGPANISSEYRQAIDGEDLLIQFLIAYLNMPSCLDYHKDTNSFSLKSEDKLKECEAILEHIDDYFKGNIKELRDIISYQPDNKVKILLGVRTTSDGKQFQTTFGRMFLKNAVSNYSKLDKEVQSTKNGGGLSDTEFEVAELHEYVVASTQFGASQTARPEQTNLPFPPASTGAAGGGATPWG